jgi:hypothetical protein
MKPEPEHLTLAHVKWLAGFTIVALLPLFVMVGHSLQTDPQEKPLQAPPNMVVAPVANHLYSGTSGQTTTSDTCTVIDAISENQTERWTIRGAATADIDHPHGWNVTESGVVTIPPQSPSGSYWAEVHTDIPCKVSNQSNIPGVMHRQILFSVANQPNNKHHRVALHK